MSTLCIDRKGFILIREINPGNCIHVSHIPTPVSGVSRDDPILTNVAHMLSVAKTGRGLEKKQTNAKELLNKRKTKPWANKH